MVVNSIFQIENEIEIIEDITIHQINKIGI